jgi:hypothetical protein
VATQVSLGQLMLRTRRRANLEGATAFLPDEELIDNLNGSIAQWWDMVRLTTFAGQIMRSSWPITTVGNQTLYPLAPDQLSIISVWILLQGTNQPIVMQPYQEEQAGLFSFLPYLAWAPGVRKLWYQEQGTSINFLPIPTTGYNIQVNYVPSSPVLSDPSESFNSVSYLEEWVVLDAAIKCLIKDGDSEMISQLTQRLAAQEARITRSIANTQMQSEGVHEDTAYSDCSYFGIGGFG